MSDSETIEYRLFNSFQNDDNKKGLELMTEAKNLFENKEITEQQYKTLTNIYS